MPAPAESPDAIPDLDADPLFQPDSVHSPQGRGSVAVGHDPPKLGDAPVEIPGKVAEGRGTALSKEHCLTHWPKSTFCDVCNRAQLYSKRARSVRQSDDRIDLPDPDQQLACDHINTSSFSDQLRLREKNMLYSSSKIIPRKSFKHILQFPGMLHKWLHLASTSLVRAAVILPL